RRLLLNGSDNPVVGVADVHAHQLAVEVEISFALGRPEIDTFGLGHRQRIERLLRGPLEDRVLLRVTNDVVGGHERMPRFRNDPRAALPTNVPPSMTTLPREITVSVTPVTSRPSYGL